MPNRLLPPARHNCSVAFCSVFGPCRNGSPFCNSPSRPEGPVGGCKAHSLPRWKEKVSTSICYRPSMAFRRPLHKKVNCRTEPRNSACSTDYRADADCGRGRLVPRFWTAGEGGLSPVFSPHEPQCRIRLQNITCCTEWTELTPNRLLPPARHNCSREGGRDWITSPAQRARKSIFHPPLRSRSVGGRGGWGRSYCRRPSSGSGRRGGLQIQLVRGQALATAGGDCKFCRTGNENKSVRKNTFQHDSQCMR